jgi:hypothetical protein
VASFVASARKAGLGVGFYYSDATNCYCRVSGGVVVPGEAKPGQINVTQQQYDNLVVAQLTELWTDYGPLEEIWFDGGYVNPTGTSAYVSSMSALLLRLYSVCHVNGGMCCKHA